MRFRKLFVSGKRNSKFWNLSLRVLPETDLVIPWSNNKSLRIFKRKSLPRFPTFFWHVTSVPREKNNNSWSDREKRVRAFGKTKTSAWMCFGATNFYTWIFRPFSTRACWVFPQGKIDKKAKIKRENVRKRETVLWIKSANKRSFFPLGDMWGWLSGTEGGSPVCCAPYEGEAE